MEDLIPVELSLQQWQGILNVIDQSNAPHVKVVAVQNLLTKKINKQLEEKQKITDVT